MPTYDLENFEDDAPSSRPQSCLLTQCVDDEDTDVQDVTTEIVETWIRSEPLAVENSFSVSRENHSNHDGVVLPIDAQLSQCDSQKSLAKRNESNSSLRRSTGIFFLKKFEHFVPQPKFAFYVCLFRLEGLLS